MAGDGSRSAGGRNISAFENDFDFPESFIENVSALELSALCCDEDLKGYDKNSGATWIYPTNYPVRDYQYNIVKSALFKNTLVSLPTGLGKTFIAAVVMYNYYRWYPTGKIIFVAPTRPLVAQQIDACYNIMAIPPGDTIEMTGTTQTATRKVEWQQKRVFFATPQVVQNDLESGICPGELVRCLVIDEAHRARGRHSYCQLIESLFLKGQTLFRVLALSATPGSKVEDVINVVQNLKIAHLELRTEECLDVSAYSHSRKIQTVVVPLGGELSSILNEFIKILDIYTRRLVQYRVIHGNIGGLSKGRIVMLFKEYQTREKSQRHPQHKQIMHDFTKVITLYHAMELLTKHGARVFLNFFDEHTDKTWVSKDDSLTMFLERLRDDLGRNPLDVDTSTLPNGVVPKIKEDLKFGHPKFDHLKKIILEHFNSAKSKGIITKAIVFCEYRESVNLVHCLLLQCRPLIKPHMFIGQGLKSSGDKKLVKAFSQKQQLRVMKAFRDGECNVLVSTCVGEEGLDVGSVDLIICFDISNKSPIRLIQRCGRTGRERGGRVFILVTEGREHETLRDCIYQRDHLNQRLLQSKELQKRLYTANPKMLPVNVVPTCQKMFITVNKKSNDENATKETKKMQTKLKDLFAKNANEDNTQKSQNILSENNNISALNFIPKTAMLWNRSKNNDFTANDKIDLSKWIEWQRNLQYTAQIEHSKDSNMLSELLKFADNKRFNIVPSVSQSIPINKEINQPVNIVRKNERKNLNKIKNFNIRDMFVKINKINDKEYCIYDDKYNEILSECEINISKQEDIKVQLNQFNVSLKLFDLIVKFNIERDKNVTSSKPSMSNVRQLIKKYSSTVTNSLNVYTVPSMSLLDSVSLSSIENVKQYLNNNLEEESFFKCSQSYHNTRNKSQNNENSNREPDKVNMIDMDSIFEDCSLSENVLEKNCEMESKMPLNFFGLNTIEDIFADDSITEPSPKLPTVNNESDNKSINKSALDFFGLNNIDDIFIDDTFNEKNVNETEYDQDNVTEIPLSPILSKKVYGKNRMTQNNELIIKNNLSDNGTKNCISSNQSIEKSIKTSDMEKAVIEDQINNMVNKNVISLDFLDDSSDDSSKSVILQTQKPSKKLTISGLNVTKNKVVVSTSSEDSLDDFEIDNVINKSVVNTKKCCNEKKFENGEDQNRNSNEETSQFFNNKTNKPTIKLSLKNKCNSMKSSYDKDSLRNVHKKGDMDSENGSIITLKYLEQFDRNKQSKGNRRLDNEIHHYNYTDNLSRECLKDLDNKLNTMSATANKNKKKKHLKRKCSFIDDEARLSDDSNVTSSGTDSEDDINTSINNFICDEQIELNLDIDMQTKYLQSVRSPVKTFGGFKIPAVPNKAMDVFSQVHVEQDSAYELDSFCVDVDLDLTQSCEMSELEIAEKILNKKRRRKKTVYKDDEQSTPESFSDEGSVKNKRKRACLRIDSESSSDEE